MVDTLCLVCQYVFAKQSQALRGLGQLTGWLGHDQSHLGSLILDPCAATVGLGGVVATWADLVAHACLAPNSQSTS